MATNSQPQETPEYRTFREHYDRLVHAIQDPLSLATRLFAQGIITYEVKDRVNILGLSKLEKTDKLLSAVEGQIRSDPNMFQNFLSALNKDPSMHSLVESMQRALLTTTSGAHGGGLSVDHESRDGEELSTPAVKRKCVHDEHGMSLVSGLEKESVHDDSVTLPRHVHHQHQSSNHLHHPYLSSVWPFQSSSQPCYPIPLNQPLFTPILDHPEHHTTRQFQPAYCHPSHHSFYPSPLQVPKPSELSYQTPSRQPSFQPSVYPICTYQLPYQATRQFPFLTLLQPSRLSSSQLPPPLHPDSPLGKYATFLKDYYTRHHAPWSKWPQVDTKKYINLAVIKNEYANREDLVQFREQTIRGSIDDILEWKAPIRMEDILKPNCVYDIHDDEKHEHYPVTQLLIEGAPGIGKSTFAWEVCQKWGQHQLFNEYSLAVLLKFQDKRVQEAKSVFDLFYYPLPELQSDIIRDIVLSGGHGLLLILEGFDEAPAAKRTMNSIFVRLFRGEELPKATLILTTRPSASADLREFCKGKHSRRIEIIGFGKKEIDEYTRCAFSDEQSRSDFKEYLSLHPHIHSMMYVPLNSAIVTHVYESCKSSGAVVPKTMTQLYSSLIRTLLLRYLKDKEAYKDTCTTVTSFKDLPQPVYDQFCEICKIAYTGIVCAETELIFQDLPSDFDPLGLMQSCPELYMDRGASVSYNFLHLTVQEYLAAYHISQQNRDEQVAFMIEHIESKKLEVVVRFLAGLSELGRDLWDVVRDIASVAKPEFLENSLLEEETNFVQFKILHLLFESQDSSAITSVLGSGYVCFYHNCESALPFDWYVLGYCITHSRCNWKLELKVCDLESVELLLRTLNLQCQLPSTGQIKGVWLDKSDPAAVNFLVDNMPHTFQNLTHLGLMDNGLTSETSNLLSMHTDLLRHLEYLNLSINPNIGRGGAVDLITSLTKFSIIRELNLNSTSIGLEDCKALSELLASSMGIELLNIGGNVLSPDCIQFIVDGLSLNTSLEKLDMRHSNFSSDNVLYLASVLRVNTRLKELDIEKCNIQSSDSVYLAIALESNTQLQTLWLGSNPFGSKGVVALADVLATNKSLTELNMEVCYIHVEGAVCLAKAIEKNSTLREFDISDNPIGSEGAFAFASMLKKNQCLKILWLRDDSVDVDGALELIESLKHNTTLEKLVLSEKCKPPSFSTLDKTLQHRVTFQYTWCYV